MKLISIVVPCYNEEDAIPIFYKEIDKIIKKIDANFELLFIDDGSSDNTLNIIKNLRKNDKRIRYISFSRNFGKEAGLYAGLEHSNGDFVTVMDVDMQDPPSYLIEMYDYVKDGKYDCAALYTKNHKDYSLFRKFFTSIWYKVIGKLSSVKQMPGARDFRLMSRQMVNSILSMKEYNRYSKGIFSFVGFNTKWINYQTPARIAGKTKWSFFKLFKYALEGIVAFSTTPLVISAIIGLILTFIAFIFLIVIIVRTLIWSDPVSGWPSLACIIIFIGGLQMFFFGIMGMYLSKTYLEIKKRPIYIIKETEK